MEPELRLVRHCYTSSTKPVNAEDGSQSSDINKYSGKCRTFFLAERSIQISKETRERRKGFLEVFVLGGETEKFEQCVSAGFPLFSERYSMSPS